MGGHSSWGSWELELPPQKFKDICDAVNGLFLMKQLPVSNYRISRAKTGWVVVFWRDVEDELGPMLPEAYPATDILRDGQAALREFESKMEFETEKSFSIIRGRD